ncbi:TRAP transporter substrate-binding protein [Afifella sp. JA880]|uniref:TRAP transporter substrate-binding protein n=1 Tax=Afifella sp. JA880 TaxID=2975280 RepID=UPI0021BB5A11|nr:TRAP transporter substrate-binding protein [Afifella sp. JA880]MCT8266553.1 TRAP transporter substrate-binding protein [Afifella sp. JA880]
MLRAVCLGLAVALGFSASAAAQEVTLKIHQFLPAQAAIPADFIKPWADKVTKESDGRIAFELYPSMQLGGKPPALIDQARDGVVDIIWTLSGYTPGRFPKTEAFELPFLPVDGETTSRAFYDFYEKHLQDEYKDFKVITVHVHSPGLLHLKGKGVHKLEDMQGLKLRGSTRMVTELLETLGSVPVGMPVPVVPEALSRGVLDGAALPWEVTGPLKIAELVDSHTTFAGDRGLYTATCVFLMNKSAYEALPDDLKKVIDDNSGREAAAWAGRVMDEADIPGRKAAEEAGNDIVVLDEAETERWKTEAKEVETSWIADMTQRGFDGKALVEDAKRLVEKYASKQ